MEAEDSRTQFSVVTFSDYATIRSNLATATETLSTLDSAPFENGMTWTEDGIEKCQQTLDNSLPGRKPITLLVSDGLPNKPSWATGEAEAKRAATVSKDNGTYMVTLFINDNYDQTAIDLMSEISSDGEVTYAQGFDALDGLVETMKSEVFPC